MEFLIRFSQNYESFQKAEIEALAILEGVTMAVVSYESDVGSSRHPEEVTLICDSLHSALLNCSLRMQQRN